MSYNDNFLKAGAIAKEVRAYGASLVVKGASYNDIVEKIVAKTHELGAVCAFPPQLAINETAAHFIPDPKEDVIFSDELVSLDIGVCYEGAIGDCAITIDLSGKHEKLVQASRQALLEAQKILKVGVTLGEIGAVIEKTIQSYGFEPVRNLSGHGLGEFQIHTKPTIPNFDNGSTTTLKPGMTFAIEPFASTGAGLIYDAGTPYIFTFVQKQAVRSPIAKEVLKKITAKQGLPFSMHELIDAKTPYHKVKFGLNELEKLGVIQGHAPLIDEAKGMVSQAENSILIDEDGTVIVTTE